MKLTNEEIKEIYIQDIEDYCNVIFDRDNLPAGVKIALMKCMEYDPSNYGIASEQLSDMSQTYKNTDELIKEIHSSIQKYARLHLAGDKAKRPYVSGR